MPGQQHSLGAERRRAEPAEHAPAAAVVQNAEREHMLADPGCRDQNPLGLQLRQARPGRMPGDLVPQVRFQHRDVQLVLAEQDQPVPGLQVQEVRQAIRANALGPGRPQQHAVQVGEPLQILAENCPSQYVPSGTVRARAIQVGHLGQHARRRPRE